MKSRWFVLVAASAALVFLGSCIYVSNLRPVANFTATPLSGPTPLDVILDATRSSDPNGTIAAYLWDFGDHQTSSQSVFPFTHRFTVQSESQTFTIVLTVVDDEEGTDTAVARITVYP